MEGGFVSPNCPLLPQLSCPAGKGEGTVRETRTDDKTGKRDFLKKEAQTRMTLFYHGSFKMGSVKMFLSSLLQCRIWASLLNINSCNTPEMDSNFPK